MHTVLIIYCNITLGKRAFEMKPLLSATLNFDYSNYTANDVSARWKSVAFFFKCGWTTERKEPKIKNNAIIKISNKIRNEFCQTNQTYSENGIKCAFWREKEQKEKKEKKESERVREKREYEAITRGVSDGKTQYEEAKFAGVRFSFSSIWAQNVSFVFLFHFFFSSLCCRTLCNSHGNFCQSCGNEGSPVRWPTTEFVEHFPKCWVLKEFKYMKKWLAWVRVNTNKIKSGSSAQQQSDELSVQKMFRA